MDPGGDGEEGVGDQSRPTEAAAAAAAEQAGAGGAQQPSRYESQKRRDWNTFQQYLRNHRPPLNLARCSGAHVIEFLKYLDQFGKTKVHAAGCSYFGHPNPPAPCACPLRQAWGSLDALIGRLRAAYEENGGGRPENNPFGARPVGSYLREVKESQSKARGIPYEKKRKRKRSAPPPSPSVPAAAAGEGPTAASSGGAVASSSEIIVKSSTPPPAAAAAEASPAPAAAAATTTTTASSSTTSTTHHH